MPRGREDEMRLNVKALMFTSAILWGGAVLLTALVNLANAGYGGALLQVVASIYPGYHASRTMSDVIVGTLYALVDGALAGLIFGWVYNRLAAR